MTQIMSAAGMRELANVCAALTETVNHARYRFPNIIKVTDPDGHPLGALVRDTYEYRFHAKETT